MKNLNAKIIASITLIALLLLAPAMAHAKTTRAKPQDKTIISLPPFSDKDQEIIARLQDYLNGLQSLSADFIQVDDMGGVMGGKIALMRRKNGDGKMRVTYDTPNRDFIVADGTMVHIWDDELKSQTNVEQGTSLAEFILRDPINLAGDIRVTRLTRAPAKIELSLVEAGDEAAGELTLVFEDAPLQIRQWTVRDPAGHTTGVSLRNIRAGETFPPSTFIFTPPGFGKGGKAQ